MTRALLILLIGLLAGAGAFYCIRQQQGSLTSRQHVARDGHTRLPELEWLRRKLDLSDEQFAKVAEAHEAYRPSCEALCMKVMASHAKIKKLANVSTPVSPELESALTEHAMLHVECQKAMLNHIHKTASLMSPKQAKSYLDALLPEVIELPLEPGNDLHGH
jgi:hypothetical protein